MKNLEDLIGQKIPRYKSKQILIIKDQNQVGFTSKEWLIEKLNFYDITFLSIPSILLRFYDLKEVVFSLVQYENLSNEDKDVINDLEKRGVIIDFYSDSEV